MTTLRKAAQQALETLEWHLERGAYGADIEGVACALRAALVEHDKDRVRIAERKAQWAEQLQLARETQERDRQQREYEEQRLAALAEPEPCQYPDCVDNGPEGKCNRWLLAECEKSEDYKPQREPLAEPVAWLVTTEMQDGTRRTYPMTGRLKDAKDACDFGEPAPLYFAPPQRKPLTDEEIEQAAAPYYGTMGFRVEAFARAIEKAHGIT